MFSRGSLLFIVALAASVAPSYPADAGLTLDLAEDQVPTLVGSAADEEFGYSLASGDLDGDGSLDLVVGAPGHEVPELGHNTGAVYIFDARSVVDGTAPVAADAARLLLTGDGARSRFGQTLVVGDLTGDGVGDLVVGAPAWGGDESIAAGRVYVYFGHAEADGDTTAADIVLSGHSPGDRLGSSVAVADADGDGAIDLLVSAYRARGPGGVRGGVIYVVPAALLLASPGELDVVDLATSLLVGEHDDDGLLEVAVADVDGDGSQDIVATAPFADGAEKDEIDVGRVYVLPQAALAGARIVAVSEAARSVFSGRSPRGLLGSSMALSDVDGDGIADLIASAPAARPKGVKIDAWGETYLVFGRADGAGGLVDLPGDGAVSFVAQSKWDLFGLPVIADDLNGDRVADIVIAAQFADPPGGTRRRCGEVSIYWGSLPSVMDAKSGKAGLADVTIVGGSTMESIGGALLSARISGGATPDLVIGAPEGKGRTDTDDKTGRLYVVPTGILIDRPPR